MAIGIIYLDFLKVLNVKSLKDQRKYSLMKKVKLCNLYELIFSILNFECIRNEYCIVSKIITKPI